MLRNKFLPALSVIMAVTGVTGCGEGAVQTSSQTTTGITAYAPADNAPLNWPVPQFKAIDENGQSFDSSVLNGHVWIVDVFLDRERDTVYQALKPLVQVATIVPFSQPTLFGINGGGDWYYTDGDIAILSAVSGNRESVMGPRSPALTVKDWIFGALSPRT